jgi:hypothetical protein
MRVDTSLTDSIPAATRSASAPKGESSFKSVLKAASTGASKPSGAPETTQAVAGHAYAEILTGPRAGMYLNTTHNKRAGQAFVMVERNGVEYHVYGTGNHRTVVEMKRHTPAAASPTGAGGTAAGTVTAGQITTDTSTA